MCSRTDKLGIFTCRVGCWNGFPDMCYCVTFIMTWLYYHITYYYEISLGLYVFKDRQPRICYFRAWCWNGFPDMQCTIVCASLWTWLYYDNTYYYKIWLGLHVLKDWQPGIFAFSRLMLDWLSRHVLLPDLHCNMTLLTHHLLLQNFTRCTHVFKDWQPRSF